MVNECNADKIRELIDVLNYHTKLYDEGHPEISDKEWDDLYFELFRLENITEIYYKDSPTQGINFQVVNQLNKVEHNHPMLSLAKTKDLEEVKKMFNNDYFMMAKMDGLTCSLRYENGYLVGAETRGNGIIGEDILHNALVVKNIPNKIPYLKPITIDGEIVCKYQDFKKFEKEYKNPRNFASGSIRLLDSKECEKRNLSFVAWDIPIGAEECEMLQDKMQLLNDLNFVVVPGSPSLEIPLDMAVFQIVDLCNHLGFPIDGIVFKFNDCKKYNSIGRTDHHFKGGIAYKFYDEEYETTLKDIEWTMGRTGVLTPVAIFEPVDADGSVIEKASLHNVSVAHDTLGGLCFGWKNQKISVFKANMIIPQISKAEEDDERTKEYFTLPHICPICGGDVQVKKEVDSEMLYCVNPQCEGKLVNRIEHFFGKKGLDAKGISKATISKLIDLGWVTRIADVFDLSRYASEWKSLPGFGEKSVSNILGSIEACRNCDLESAIAGIGIPLVGRTVARDLAKRFANYGAFKENIEGSFDFSTLGGYGYEMNKSLKTFDYSELDYIVENYLIFKEEKNEENEQNLEGLTFCVTGKVSIFKNRDELSAFIESKGGKVTGSVSKNTNYLINNDTESTSAKNKKAKELNIKIIGEQTFMDMFDFSK